MAVERVTERDDGGVRERVVERDDEPVYMERSGASIAGVIIGLAALALVAIVAFFLLSRTTSDELPTNAVTGPAAAVADSAATTARNVGDTASDAAHKAGGAPETPKGQ
jgi:hypothetical protein